MEIIFLPLGLLSLLIFFSGLPSSLDFYTIYTNYLDSKFYAK